MEQTLFTGLRHLYSTTEDNPNTIRIRMRLRDPVDPDVFRRAVDLTMRRYPYFSVELRKRDGQYVFADNDRPVVVRDSLEGVTLNSPAAHDHLIAFAYWDDWLTLDVFHGLTDGTGAYAVLRTLLYYYCAEGYGVTLNPEGIRLAGDVIPMAEWEDPVANRTDLPTPPRIELPTALNLAKAAGFTHDPRPTVYHVTFSEPAFMRLVKAHGGSPATMVSLLFCRAVAALYPEAENVIRVALCADQRNALHAPLAHQSLVGGVMLDFTDDFRGLSISEQVGAFRQKVSDGTQEVPTLMGIESQAAFNRAILSETDDAKRVGVVDAFNAFTRRVITASVSYVGRGDFREADAYIRDFYAWTCAPACGLLLELSAAGGRFSVDCIQLFSSPVIVTAFLKELSARGIAYDVSDGRPLALPKVDLPWLKPVGQQ